MTSLSAADLASVPLFAALDERTREHLARVIEVEDHKSGHAIVREGTSGYAFYVIKDGTVAVTHDDAQLRTMSAGEFFGEISLAGAGRRTATVTATSPVTVWVIFGTDFRVLADQNPDVAAALTAAVESRLATG